MNSSEKPLNILFVCLGNICRSPLAEGIFKNLLQEEGLSSKVRAESAGTSSSHEGEAYHPMSQKVASENGIKLIGRSRPVIDTDFEEFDYLIAMDISNRDHLRQRAPGRDYFQRIFLMRAFEQEGPSFDTFDQFEVPDPYFGAENGFYGVYEILDKACRGYLNWLRENHPHLRSS